jgi:Tfp pilus assembly protein FimT
MRRGVTLLELVLILTVVGILAGIAMPRLNAVADALEVHAAASDISAAHRRARIIAVLQSRIVELSIDTNDLVIRPRGDTIELWHIRGPAARQVTLAGPPRLITFSPVGLSMGVSNASFHLTRGAASRTVVVSRLGRVRVTTP